MHRYSQRCKESMPFIVQHEKMTRKQNHAPFWQGHWHDCTDKESTYRLSTFCCSDIFRSDLLAAPFLFFMAAAICGVAYCKWCRCCGACWKGTAGPTCTPSAAPMTNEGFPSWSSWVVTIPPALGTAMTLPSSVTRDAWFAIWSPSPDAMTASSSSPCWSLRKIVSPSGVNKTSPKMSSKLRVAGVPRWATAAEALADSSDVVKRGADMVSIRYDWFVYSMTFDPETNKSCESLQAARILCHRRDHQIWIFVLICALHTSTIWSACISGAPLYRSITSELSCHFIIQSNSN